MIGTVSENWRRRIEHCSRDYSENNSSDCLLRYVDRIEFTFWLDTSAHDHHNPANAPPPLIHTHFVGAGIIPFPKDMFSRKGIANTLRQV